MLSQEPSSRVFFRRPHNPRFGQSITSASIGTNPKARGLGLEIVHRNRPSPRRRANLSRINRAWSSENNNDPVFARCNSSPCQLGHMMPWRECAFKPNSKCPSSCAITWAQHSRQTDMPFPVQFIHRVVGCVAVSPVPSADRNATPQNSVAYFRGKRDDSQVKMRCRRWILAARVSLHVR